MSLPRRAAALALVVAVGSGCAAPSPQGSASPSPGVSASPGTATVTASPTPTGAAVDLTEPGAAQRLVDDLLAEADATRAIMVTVTQTEASVTVLKKGVPQTWAWRDGRIQQVPSDIAYVDQRSFDPSAFDLSDVGALFRAAESVSGSRAGQSLQIVDYSAGLVSLSVSTSPETRTVFFEADGTLLPTLDFDSAWGLARGYADVTDGQARASALGFGSASGVYLDTPHETNGSHERRQRTARTPVFVSARSESSDLPAFDPALIDPATVWAVLMRLRDEGLFVIGDAWSCVADDREGRGEPSLHCTVGDTTVVTDAAGEVLA